MSKLHGAAELNALPPDEFKKAVLNIVGFFDRIEPDKDDPHDLGGYPTSAAAIFLARHCSEMNSNFSLLLDEEYIELYKSDWKPK